MFAEPTLITGDLHRVLPQTLTVYYPTMNISKFYLNSLNLKKKTKKTQQQQQQQQQQQKQIIRPYSFQKSTEDS